MKRFGIKLILALAVAFSSVAIGQEESKPILVDELGLHGCEDFASRIDAWIQESKNHVNLYGFALVSGPADDLLGRITYREWIKGQLLWRFENKADRDRFAILENGLNDKLKVELWLAKKNESSVTQKETAWDLSLRITKPQPYYRSTGDGGICPNIDHAAVFKQLIDANPRLNGRVVFHERNSRRFLRAKAEFLAKSPQVSAVRFTFARPPASAVFYDGHFEYWFIPLRK